MTYCEKCGAEVSQGAQFCALCGAPVRGAGQVVSIGAEQPKNRPTRAWYLAPILFSLLGGIVGFIVVRKKDKQLANRLLIVGIVVFVLVMVGYLYVGLLSPSP